MRRVVFRLMCWVRTRPSRICLVLTGVLLACFFFRHLWVTLAPRISGARARAAWHNWQAKDYVDFEGFDNNTGSSYLIVPNIVHFIRFRKKTLDFVDFLCVMAAMKIQKPNAIYIHTDVPEFEGYYWSLLRGNISKDILQVRPLWSPTYIFGQRLSSVHHSADVARIQVLQQHGGIFLDNDALLLKSLDYFRHFEMTIGWPHGQSIGTQVLVAHNKARFLSRWLDCYRQYKPRLWYHNAGDAPTQIVLVPQPHLVHRVPVSFGVHQLVQELYLTNWEGWKELHAVHLLARHRSYLARKDLELSGILDFDEFNVRWYDRAFGQMARWVLYGTTKLLEPPPWASPATDGVVVNGSSVGVRVASPKP